jgi:hypothetical protein
MVLRRNRTRRLATVLHPANPGGAHQPADRRGTIRHRERWSAEHGARLPARMREGPRPAFRPCSRPFWPASAPRERDVQQGGDGPGNGATVRRRRHASPCDPALSATEVQGQKNEADKRPRLTRAVRVQGKTVPKGTTQSCARLVNKALTPFDTGAPAERRPRPFRFAANQGPRCRFSLWPSAKTLHLFGIML